MSFSTSLKRLAVAGLLLSSLTGRAQTLTQSNFTAVSVPQYLVNGPTSPATGRIPFAYRATVSGLAASTLYRYFNQLVAVGNQPNPTLTPQPTDIGTTNGGAGNVLLIAPGATSAATTYKYTTSPGFTLAANYGTFTTDAAGNFTGWFANVTTTNGRFAAGNLVTPSIILVPDATPADATTIRRFALNQSIASLVLGAAAGNATYLRGSSLATPKNLVALYDNAAGTGRPLNIAVVENIGAAIASTVTGYSTANGDYNTSIPNTNAAGVRRLLQLSVVDASIVGCQNSTTPFTGTDNPSGGFTPVTIASTTAPLDVNNCTPTVSIAPTATQNIVTGANGTTLTATEANGTATARQWAYGTVAAGPYGTTVVGATGASYTPNFSAAGTYYVVVNSTIGGTVYTSNAVQVNVTAVAANPLIAVTQTAGGAAQANGSTFAGFASTAVGSSSAPVSFTITNASTTDALAISSIVFAGDFALSGTAPTTVTANGGTATLGVVFSPTATGTRTGSVTINNNSTANAAYAINLSGTATAAAVPVPTATGYSTTSLLAGIRSNVAVAGTNLSGATVAVTGSTAGAVTVGTVSGTATTANFTLLAPGAGGFTLTITTAGGVITQAFTVTAAPAGFFEPFEAATQAGYPLVTAPATVALTSGSYTFVQALLGAITPAGDRKNQGQSLRVRGGAAVTFTKTGGVGTLSLLAGLFGTDTGLTFTLGFRPAGSAGAFTAVTGIPATLTPTLTAYSFVLNQAGSVEIQIGSTNAAIGVNPRLNIDDLAISDFPAAPVGNLLVNTAGQTISGTYNNVTVADGGTATLGGTLTVNGALVVQDGGTLNLNCQAIAGPGTVNVNAGGTLGICDAAGLPATAGRTFSPDANYVYNGTVAQASGAGLPATVRSLTVNNATGLTLAQATGVAQLVRLQSGNLASNGNLTLRSVAGVGTALVDNTGGAVTGNGTMQRATDSNTNGTIGYHQYSSPVAATTLADLDVPAGLPGGAYANTYNTAYNTAANPGIVRPFPTVFGYDEARLATSPATTLDAFSKGWFSPAAATAAMEVGKGYSANIPNALLVDFVGTLNNGPVNITGLARGTDGEAGWQFVGNPYPAPLNWDNVAAARRAGLDGAMYVANSTGPYTGVYRSRANGVGISPLIVAGSGFFVRTLAGQTGVLNLLNGDRETTFGAQPAFGRDSRPVLALTLANAAGTQADDAYVYLQTGATAGFDSQFDAAKLPNSTGLNLTVMAGAERLAISGLPLLVGTTLVPLTVGVPAVGNYVFTLGQLANFGGTNLVLRDNLTGTRTPLVVGTAYPFTVSAFSTAGRFVLELNPAAGPLASATQALAAQVQVYPNPARGSFRLTLPAPAKAATVRLTNALGQTVVTRSLTSTEADFDTAGLAPGVYTLRLVVADGTAVTRKVVVE